jgi:L-alanine-DL-glutamate epimerase-like enolase superfamily enzyme
MVNIERIALRLLRVELTQPYKLSFGTVLAFDTLLVELFLDDSRKGFGEGTILTGYTDETVDECWEAAREIAPRLRGLEANAARALLQSWIMKNPFTVTAFGTALEMAENHAALRVSGTVPILGVINTLDEKNLAREVESLTVAGYRTLKVKVGWIVDQDLARVKAVQSILAGTDIRIRIDANQGYSPEDGLRFAQSLRPENVELFEQACNADDWDAAIAVKNAARVPIMLDEAIYDMSDVERAAELKAANVIKLKLMKLGSLTALEMALERTASLGMETVLGNGVATEIGCWMEACVAVARLRDVAGEMNGFLKQKIPTLTNPLTVREGSIIIPDGYAPELDTRALAAMQVATENYHRSFVGAS